MPQNENEKWNLFSAANFAYHARNGTLNWLLTKYYQAYPHLCPPGWFGPTPAQAKAKEDAARVSQAAYVAELKRQAKAYEDEQQRQQAAYVAELKRQQAAYAAQQEREGHERERVLSRERRR